MDLERSVFKIVQTKSKVNSWHAISRVVVGDQGSRRSCEIDALIFTDRGIIVIEAKRWGGEIISWTENCVKITQGTDNREIDRRNPLNQLRVAVDNVRYELGSKDWAPSHNGFSVIDKSQIPVVSLVVFGHSTKISDDLDQTQIGLRPGEFVTDTRRLGKELDSIYQNMSSLGVYGFAGMSRILASSWPRRGVLTMKQGGKRVVFFKMGQVLRCRDGSALIACQIEEIKGKAGGAVHIRLANQKKTLKLDIESFDFTAFLEQDSHVSSIKILAKDISSFKVNP